jgi:hypothetical protein
MDTFPQQLKRLGISVRASTVVSLLKHMEYLLKVNRKDLPSPCQSGLLPLLPY